VGVIASRRRLPYLVLHGSRDPLTGLASRPTFTFELEVALGRQRRRQCTVTVMLLDLVGFGVINDSLGHVAGDEVLKGFARRLVELSPEAGTVARIGSDEFALIFEKPTTTEEAFRSAIFAGHLLQRPYRVEDADGAVFDVTASVGAVLSDRGGPSCDELLRAATAALWRSKSDPGHGVRVVKLLESEIESGGRTSGSGLETDPRPPLEDLTGIETQIEVHYQPMVAARSERLTGVEALARLRHPSRGLLYPVSFMSEAEEDGAILALGAAVIDEACAQTSAWADLGISLPMMSVNVSERQLDDPDMTHVVALSLERHGLLGPELALEVPESVAAGGGDRLLSRVLELKDLGVSITLDDFGTAGSCLSYLRHLPADFVKFHPLLTSDVATDRDAALLLSTMNDLAHAFGLETVAKAVESEAQFEAVVRLGCDHVQGYQVAGPAPAGPATDLIRKYRSHANTPRSVAYVGTTGG
jgi:diguanylate cyclase (GGDEF)-like protein